MAKEEIDSALIRKVHALESKWLFFTVLDPQQAARRSLANLQEIEEGNSRTQVVVVHSPSVRTNDMFSRYWSDRGRYEIGVSTGFFLLLFQIVELYTSGLALGRKNPSNQAVAEYLYIVRRAIIRYVDDSIAVPRWRLMYGFLKRRWEEQSGQLEIAHNLSFFLRTIIDFTVAHELGHVCLEHFSSSEAPGRDSSRREELNADRFAARLLIRTKQREMAANPEGVSQLDRDQYAELIMRLTFQSVAQFFAIYGTIERAARERGHPLACTHPPSAKRYVEFKKECARQGFREATFSADPRGPDAVFKLFNRMATLIDWKLK